MRHIFILFLALCSLATAEISVRPSNLPPITNSALETTDLLLVYDNSTGLLKKMRMSELDTRYPSSGAVTSLTGDVTGTGPGAASTSIANTVILGKTLTGFASSAGTVTSSSTILQAFNRIVGNMALLAPAANATLTGTTTVSTLKVNGLTASKIVKTDGSKNLVSSSVGVSDLSATGTPDTTTYLRGDNSWSVVTPPVWGNVTGTLADQTDLISALNLKSPLASPTFTGTVTTPALNVSGQTASTVCYLDASKNLTSSAVTPTELSYVSGVTSALQTQLNAKSPLASPTFTGTVTAPTLNVSGQTATTVPYLDASKNLVSSAVTPTELGYVSGVTSALQTQLAARTIGVSSSVASSPVVFCDTAGKNVCDAATGKTLKVPAGDTVDGGGILGLQFTGAGTDGAITNLTGIKVLYQSGTEYFQHMIDGKQIWTSQATVGGAQSTTSIAVQAQELRPDNATGTLGNTVHPWYINYANKMSVPSSIGRAIVIGNLNDSNITGIGMNAGTFGKEVYFQADVGAYYLDYFNVKTATPYTSTVISAPDETNASSLAAPSMYLKGANKTAGTGDGGDVILGGGTSLAGTAGQVFIPSISGGPAAVTTHAGFVPMWYDPGSSEFCVNHGGTVKCAAMSP